MRAADAAGWLAAFGAEDVAVTVRFPQLGGWEVTSWAVAPGEAEGSPALEVELWGADFDYPALEGVLRRLHPLLRVDVFCRLGQRLRAVTLLSEQQQGQRL